MSCLKMERVYCFLPGALLTGGNQWGLENVQGLSRQLLRITQSTAATYRNVNQT